jgi:hypothetical protein
MRGCWRQDQGARYKVQVKGDGGGLMRASDAVRSSPHPTGTVRTIRRVMAGPNLPYEFYSTIPTPARLAASLSASSLAAIGRPNLMARPRYDAS